MKKVLPILLTFLFSLSWHAHAQERIIDIAYNQNTDKGILYDIDLNGVVQNELPFTSTVNGENPQGIVLLGDFFYFGGTRSDDSGYIYEYNPQENSFKLLENFFSLDSTANNPFTLVGDSLFGVSQIDMFIVTDLLQAIFSCFLRYLPEILELQ